LGVSGWLVLGSEALAVPVISKGPIPRAWAGGCAVFIGGGPSLTDDQVEAAAKYRARRECYIFGVNDAYRKTELDALYAADPTWWDHHICQVRRTQTCPLYTQSEPAALKHGLWHTPGPNKHPPGPPGLCHNPNYIHFGHCSGYQAMNVAFHLGVSHMILLGYDYHSGGEHWFGKHPGRLNVKTNYTAFLPAMPAMAEDLAAVGVEVVNCTPGSALDCFPIMQIDTALKRLWRPCFAKLEDS
jgi:hypothetical protein